jgi:glycosyltransferase involved in cell wall biosynthesis
VASTVFQICADQRYFEQHRLVEPGKSVLIPGSGVDIEGFDHALRAAPPASQLRDALGLGASEIVITVTRLTRQKGISTLLKAAAIVNRERPAVRFLLVGPRESEGPLAISQAEIDRHAPYVIATGRRTDVPALLSLGAVFAFPTEYREGVPRALLEACLAGLPVVTTDVPGCSDVVRHGWSGFVVPQRSPRALAAAILELLIDRRTAQTMATRASAHVRQGFGLGTIVDRYAALYSQLLQSRLHLHPVGPVPSLPSDAPPANPLRSQASSA